MIILDDRQKDLMKDIINRILGNGYPSPENGLDNTYQVEYNFTAEDIQDLEFILEKLSEEEDD